MTVETAMPVRQRALAALSSVSHLVLGLSILFQFGPVGNSPAWDVMDVYSKKIAPYGFLLIFILAALGLRDRRQLQRSLYVGMVVMEVWALALAAAWIIGYGPQPSFIWLAFIGYLKWYAATYWVLYDGRTTAIDQMSNSVARTVYVSRQGRAGGGDIATP